MFPETSFIAQIVGVAIAAVLVAALAGSRWGMRRERKRQERNEVVAVLQALRGESTRNFDDMRVRLRHLETLVEGNSRVADGNRQPRGAEPADQAAPQA